MVMVIDGYATLQDAQTPECLLLPQPLVHGALGHYCSVFLGFPISRYFCSETKSVMTFYF